jgi:hypothetical protein
MKKFFSVLMLASILAVGGAGIVAAQVTPTDVPAGDFAPPTTGVPKTGSELLGKITIAGNWVFAVLIAVAVIFILMAAFDFITGQGDPEKMSSARQKIIFAAIGFGVALIATGLDNVIGSILGIS